MSNRQVAVILAAAGASRRMGQNKLLLKLGGKSVIRRSAEAFAAALPGCRLIAAVSPENEAVFARELSGLAVCFSAGGATRAESVRNALSRLDGEEIVLIHDAARPLVSAAVIQNAAALAREHGAAVPALPVKDTIRIGEGGFGVGTPDRSRLFAVQTPQAFRAADLRKAYQTASLTETDDAAVYENAGGRVFLFPGEARNIKLTAPEDIAAARAFLGVAAGMRTGTGYDVHRLVEGRRLVLCGVEIPYGKGLLGHSDADVAAHAAMDALLGAAALGDIGRHFPDSDERYRGADSCKLLAEVGRLLRAQGYCPVNLDITIVAQAPKLAPYIPAMRRRIADALGIAEDRVSVKATTTERLGFEGRGEGISAQAAAMIEENSCGNGEEML